MPREQADRTQDFRCKLIPVSGVWFHERAPGGAVGAKRVCGFAQVTLQHDCGAIVERMCQRSGRVNPFQSVIAQGQCGEKWRAGSEWMDGRSKIVLKTRQR